MGSFYEFFAGGGMARAGLGPDWECLFANDFDQKKAASYAANWGDDHLRIGDVAALTPADLLRYAPRCRPKGYPSANHHLGEPSKNLRHHAGLQCI